MIHPLLARGSISSSTYTEIANNTRSSMHALTTKMGTAAISSIVSSATRSRSDSLANKQISPKTLPSSRLSVPSIGPTAPVNPPVRLWIPPEVPEPVETIKPEEIFTITIQNGSIEIPEGNSKSGEQLPTFIPLETPIPIEGDWVFIPTRAQE